MVELPDTFTKAELFAAARNVSGLALLDTDMNRVVHGLGFVKPVPGQRGRLRYQP